jgi:hypothetical protein
MEGRLSWLNATSDYTNPNTPLDLPNLKYVSLANNGALGETFNSKGGPSVGNPDPADNAIYFNVQTVRRDFVPTAPATHGALSNFTVTVTFTDQLTQGGAAVVRNVVLTRRVVHG